MDKPAFPVSVIVFLTILTIVLFGVVGGIVYFIYNPSTASFAGRLVKNYIGKKVEVIGQGVYLRTLQDPDKDQDGLTDKAEVGVYKTDPDKFDSNGTGVGDGEYIYNIYRKAFEEDDEYPLTEYRKNLIGTFSLEDAFNTRSGETYNLYVGMPDDMRQTVKQSLDFRKAGDYAKSTNLLQQSLLKNSDSAILKYHLGLTYHGMKDYSKALSIYESIADDPMVKSPLLYSDIAAVNYALGQEAKYVDYLNLSVKDFPEDLRQYLSLASYYQEKNELNKAKEILNNGLKVEPRYADYYNALAIISNLEGDNKKEFDLYRKALAYDFLYAPGHYNLALLYDQFFNDAKNALIEARIAFEIDPSSQHLAQVILLYYKNGAVSKAKELENKLLKLTDIDSASFNSLGLMYLNQADYKQAEFYFRKAISLEPDFPNAYNNLGVVLDSTRRNAEAIASYKKAVELNPNYANAYNNLGWSYKTTGQYQEAIKALQKAIQLNPNLPNPYMNLGEVYRMMRDYPNAILNYKKSISLGGTDPVMLENLKILEKLP